MGYNTARYFNRSSAIESQIDSIFNDREQKVEMRRPRLNFAGLLSLIQL
jgi:hypothetical protein